MNTLEFILSHPLTRDSKLRSLARYVGWQVKSRMQRDNIVPWVGGTKLSVRRGMSGATGNIYVGLHEFSDMGFMLHFLREEDFFCDIGTNVGSYTVLAGGVCKARVWSFEPDPETVVSLERNIALNGLGERVAIKQTALGPENGEVHFSVGLDCINSVVEAGAGETRTVKQVRLDDILAGDAPTFMKIDVEGYELQVLKGAGKTLADTRLKAFEIETFGDEEQAIIRGHGFKRMYYDPFTRELSETSFGYVHSNFLLVRDVAFVRERVRNAPKIAVLGHSI